jgi:hypothetical protein
VPRALFHPRVVDAQKFVLRGGHVNVVGLASKRFLSRNVHGLVCGAFFRYVQTT